MGHTFFFLCMSCKVLLTAMYFRYCIDATLDSFYPRRCWWFCLLIYLVIWLDEISTVCGSHSMWLLMSWHVGFVSIFKPGFLEGWPLYLHSTVSMWRLVIGCIQPLEPVRLSSLLMGSGDTEHSHPAGCSHVCPSFTFLRPLSQFLCVCAGLSARLGLCWACSQPPVNLGYVKSF